MSTLGTIEQALAADRGDAAAAAARNYLASGEGASGAALRELGTVLTRAYRTFHGEAVNAVHESLASELGPDRAAFLLQPMKDDLDLTEKWRQLLEAVATERLSNELLDRVKANDQPGAEATAQMILAGGRPEDRGRRAKFIGTLLGGMLYEKARAETVAKAISKNPPKFGLDFMQATDMDEEFARTQAAAAKRERPATSAGRGELTQAVVELGRSLPARMAMSEPTPDQIDLFERNLRAIFRCALASPGHARFSETTLLLVEFSPKEVSAAGALAGIEARLYGTLGRTGRAVAARGLLAMGADPVAWPAYFAFTRHNLYSPVGRYGVEALGLLANPEAVPFLIETMSDKKAGARTEALFALGATGDPRAQSTLVATLEQDFKGRVMDGEARRDAALLITALGRSTRAIEDPAARSQLAARVIRSLPKDDTEFIVRAVLNFFLGKLDGMPPELLEWAAKVGTSALWSIDRPELARAGRASALGFRQPLIDLLGRLAPYAYGTINQTAMELAKTFSGAYLALAEFYGKHPDPRALPVLQQLMTNTFLRDDSKARSVYTQEKVLDVATDQKQDLDPDRIVAALIYATDRIGGDEAEGMLSNLYEQIQAGHLPRPGAETADILMQSHMKIMKARTGQALPKLGAAAAREDGEPATPAGPAALTDDDVRCLADLQASYLLAAKRRAKKVAAMAALGPRKVPAAAGAIVRHLADKDPMIAAAAMTATLDMAAPPAPAATLAQLHAELLQALESGDLDMRLKVSETLAKLGPNRSPLKEKLEALRSRPGVALALRSIADRLLGPPQGAEEAAVGVGVGETGTPAAAAPSAAANAMTNLDKKREFMLARQAWVRGGKKGPEPAPPE